MGITKLEYGRKQEKVNNFGWNSEPISRGYGRIEYNCSIEIYADEMRRIINSAPNNDLLNIPPFTITVVYGNQPGQGGVVVPYKDVIYNCEFADSNISFNEGDTKCLVTIPITCAGIVYNA